MNQNRALGLVAALAACTSIIIDTSQVHANDAPYVADFGDAPDGQNAGYSAPFAAVIGQFPTSYVTANSRYALPGGHAVITGLERLGTLISMEDGPDDAGDPDTIENFINDDFDDGLVGGLCPSPAPVAPWPPSYPVTLTFRVTVAPGAPAMTRYLNILVDANHDGVWSGPGEWIAIDQPVAIAPGSSGLVTVGPFPLPLPSSTAWLRAALTRTPVVGSFPDNGSGWDGSGTFSHGEVEDYLISGSNTGLDHAAAAAAAAARAAAFAAAVDVDYDTAHAFALALAAVDVSVDVSAAAAAAASASASAGAAAAAFASASASATAAASECATALAYAESVTAVCASCACATVCAFAQASALAAVEACAQVQVSAEVSVSAAAAAAAYASAEAAAAAAASSEASAHAAAFAAAVADADAAAAAIAVARASATAAAASAAASASTALATACGGDAAAAASASAAASAQAAAAATVFADSYAAAAADATAFALASAKASATAAAATAAGAAAGAGAAAQASSSSAASAAASASSSASNLSLTMTSASASVSASCSGTCCLDACAACFSLHVTSLGGFATQVEWAVAAGAVSYDLFARRLDGPQAICVANNVPGPSVLDSGIAIPPGRVLYYLSRSFNGLVDDTYGTRSDGQPRQVPPLCGEGCDPGGCDDQDVCTVDGCDSQTHACTHQPIACDDGNFCTQDSCDPSAGCLHAPRFGPCDDGTACTTGDSCVNGSCVATAGNCDDGNPCTTDTCTPQAGCTHSQVTGACDDGNVCTTGDQCSAGMCGGTTLACDDGNPCTNEYCNPQTGCGHTPRTGSCSDGNPCTTGDSCNAGTCAAGEPESCDDNNACTQDTCDLQTGCTHTPAGGTCEDGNPCTSGDSCSNGTCTSGTPINCDDSNACTSDICSQSGCVHTPLNSGACNDGNACTSGDFCSNGTCAAGAPVNCDDLNACTTDVCSQSGCAHTPLNSGGCDDGNPCSLGDQCSAGTCTGSSLPPDTTTLTNAAPIAIASSGPSPTYPSIINFPFRDYSITKVTVRLNGLAHAFPDDIDMQLAGPTGQRTMLMSDVGGNIFVSNLTITLDDVGPALPDSGPLTNGTFRPTNIGAGDAFPPPASTTTNAALSVFNGTPSAGPWQLFIVDDSAGGGGGSLNSGWTLAITTQCVPPAPLDVTATRDAPASATSAAGR